MRMREHFDKITIKRYQASWAASQSLLITLIKVDWSEMTVVWWLLIISHNIGTTPTLSIHPPATTTAQWQCCMTRPEWCCIVELRQLLLIIIRQLRFEEVLVHTVGKWSISELAALICSTENINTR